MLRTLRQEHPRTCRNCRSGSFDVLFQYFKPVAFPYTTLLRRFALLPKRRSIPFQSIDSGLPATTKLYWDVRTALTGGPGSDKLRNIGHALA